MEWMTKVEIKPLKRGISYEDQILSLGSCFADNIARKLSQAKFRVEASPTGILFNPYSIAEAIERCHSSECKISQSEMINTSGIWSHYDFHSSFSDVDAGIAQDKMQGALKASKEALQQANIVIITFGTAWVYRLKESGKVVANCHKQPQRIFERELLCAEAIAKRYIELLQGALSGKHVIFTLSPVRHLGDGLEGNSLSKATLRVAINQIVEHCTNAEYFPSYEIQNDELRDYRFYAEDMTHPSSQAVDYIWERFCSVAFDAEQKELIREVATITSAAEHRPFNPQSESHRTFCQNMIGKITSLQERLPFADFAEEIERFNTYL